MAERLQSQRHEPRGMKFIPLPNGGRVASGSTPFGEYRLVLSDPRGGDKTLRLVDDEGHVYGYAYVSETDPQPRAIMSANVPCVFRGDEIERRVCPTCGPVLPDGRRTGQFRVAVFECSKWSTCTIKRRLRGVGQTCVSCPNYTPMDAI